MLNEHLFGVCVCEGTNTSAEHEGRTRSFPHVRGNWASFVFVPALLLTAKKSLLEHFSVHLKDVLRLMVCYIWNNYQ